MLPAKEGGGGGSKGCHVAASDSVQVNDKKLNRAKKVKESTSTRHCIPEQSPILPKKSVVPAVEVKTAACVKAAAGSEAGTSAGAVAKRAESGLETGVSRSRSRSSILSEAEDSAGWISISESSSSSDDGWPPNGFGLRSTMYINGRRLKRGSLRQSTRRSRQRRRAQRAHSRCRHRKNLRNLLVAYTLVPEGKGSDNLWSSDSASDDESQADKRLDKSNGKTSVSPNDNPNKNSSANTNNKADENTIVDPNNNPHESRGAIPKNRANDDTGRKVVTSNSTLHGHCDGTAVGITDKDETRNIVTGPGGGLVGFTGLGLDLAVEQGTGGPRPPIPGPSARSDRTPGEGVTAKRDLCQIEQFG